MRLEVENISRNRIITDINQIEIKKMIYHGESHLIAKIFKEDESELLEMDKIIKIESRKGG